MVRGFIEKPAPPTVREIVPPDTDRAFPVLADAFSWPSKAQNAYVDRVDHVLRPTGYRLLGAFHEGAPAAAAVAVAGFRLIHSNAWGDHLWIDDLVCGEEWFPGLVIGELVRFLEAEARRLEVSQIHLDVPDVWEEGFVPPRPHDDPLDPLRRSLRIPEGPEGDRLRAVDTGFQIVGARAVLMLFPDDDQPASPELDSSAPYAEWPTSPDARLRAAALRFRKPRRGSH